MTIANIYIWSANGHTPITGRTGGYCDELFVGSIEVADPDDAKAKVRELIATIPHAAYGHYDLPEWWNHNLRDGYVSR